MSHFSKQNIKNLIVILIVICSEYSSNTVIDLKTLLD
jgi:hypothetical protein